MQPNMQFFYKTFLELDCGNMVAILAFDSTALGELLHEKNNHLFSDEYPIIYKVKMRKSLSLNYYYTNAIDNAIKNA